MTNTKKLDIKNICKEVKLGDAYHIRGMLLQIIKERGTIFLIFSNSIIVDLKNILKTKQVSANTMYNTLLSLCFETFDVDCTITEINLDSEPGFVVADCITIKIDVKEYIKNNSNAYEH